MIDKGLCPVIVRTLISMYIHQKVSVKWKNNYSPQFSISNGVKQGGILSPTLFINYIDEILVQYQKNRIGWHIGNVFCGAFGYADDIVLIAPTKYGLDTMLNEAKQFADSMDILFNANKCKYMIFGDMTNVINKSIFFNGVMIECTDYELHLGNPLDSRNSNRIIEEAVKYLYKNFNSIMYKFQFATSDVKYFLFKSYCMSVYGSCLWDYDSVNVNAFYIAWRKCCRRMFNVPYRTHNIFIHYLEDEDSDIQLHLRFLNIIGKMINSDNQIVQLCSNMAIKGSRSNVSKTVNVVCEKYKFDKSLLHSVNCTFKCVKVDNPDIAQCDVIRDFLIASEDIFTSNEDKQNCKYIVNFLCT